jgi:hypothetical protein
VRLDDDDWTHPLRGCERPPQDTPSVTNEFSHPDIRIALTILAYRYSGLRLSDTAPLLAHLKEKVESEFGPLGQRPTSRLFVRWVQLGGGRVKVSVRQDTLCGSFLRPIFQPENCSGFHGRIAMNEACG